VILQAATVCFDASVYEIYGALLNGGTLLLPPAGRLTVDQLGRCLREGGVTQLFLTTGLFQVMVDEELDSFSSVRQVLTGGDIVSVDHMRRMREAHPECRLVHCYGPTENTTYTTCHDVVASDFARRTVPVGGPIANSTVWILDEAGRPLAPGIPGELCTGGDGVGLEYLGRPQLTSDKFVPDSLSSNPEENARLYRTGDIARYRDDGTIEFVGRIDHQVKIRGFRVEPGEIENCLARHPRVAQAKIVVRGEKAAEKSLVAYAAPVGGLDVTGEELAGYLRSKLPEYMIPSSFVVLDELPLNANGKVDTKALPDPSTGSPSSNTEADLPERDPNPTETELIALWESVLDVSAPGIDDDFFALGGHSLLGMRLFARIQKRFAVSLPLATLFDAPTVRQLATVIDGTNGTVHETASPPAEASRNGTPHPSAAGRKGHGHHLPQTANSFPAAKANGSPPPGANGSSSAGPKQAITVAIRAKGSRPPLFAVHGGDGGVLFYGELSERLGSDQPFHAFECPALTAGGPIPEDTVEETAATYLAEMRRIHPSGPYHLCGYSYGGVVAYEMACQLREQGQDVAFLGLVDTENPAVEARKLGIGERVRLNWTSRNRPGAGVLEKAGNLTRRIGAGAAYKAYFEAECTLARALPDAKNAGWLRQVQLRLAHERAMGEFRPRRFDGRLTLFRAMVGGDKFDLGEDYGWQSLVADLDTIDIPGNHVTVFDRKNIDGVAAAFRQALEKPVPAVIS